MEKFFASIVPILEKATFKRVLAVGLLIMFGLIGYIGYTQAPALGKFLFSSESSTGNKPFVHIPPESEQTIGIFMRKHTEVVYLTVLTFQFEKNTRLPIYRAFNSDELKKIIYERLNGGDGALPMFIKNDSSNNAQVIALITGETHCDPFTGGGLARVWPDLATKLTMSCRVPIPPVFGNNIPGYMVVHVTKKLTDYEVEVLKLDLILLSKTINDINNR
jgi:hypothetical protein